MWLLGHKRFNNKSHSTGPGLTKFLFIKLVAMILGIIVPKLNKGYLVLGNQVSKNIISIVKIYPS